VETEFIMHQPIPEEKKDTLLKYSHVCPNTEYSLQKLNKNSKDFNEIITLTDQLLYIEDMLCNKRKNVIYENKKYVTMIEGRLNNLLNEHNIPDKSYPFRHKIFIETKYDEMEGDIRNKIGRFITKNIPKLIKS